MKKSFKILLAAFAFFAIASTAKAQGKQGYVSFASVVNGLPAMAGVTKQLQDYQKQFATQYQQMGSEYQIKLEAYKKIPAGTTNDAKRTAAESELTDLQNRLQSFQTNAQTSMQTKQGTLTDPLVQQVKVAIEALAKEKGYTSIMDTTNQIMIVFPTADDITAAVKLKLGVK